jgi:hypothetical protein
VGRIDGYGCDISFTIIKNGIGERFSDTGYFVVNNFNKETGVYSTTIYDMARFYDSSGNLR